MAVPAANRWTPPLLDGLSAAGAFHLFFRALENFTRDQIALALTYGVLVGVFATPGQWRLVGRYLLLIPLTVATVAFAPVAFLLEPYVAIPAVCLIPLAARATRPGPLVRRVALFLPVYVAVGVAVFVPFAEFPAAVGRYAALYVAALGLGWLALAQPEPGRHVWSYLLLLFALATVPALASRYLPCDESLLERVARQPGVEVLFTNQTSLDLPANRMEILCDPASGIRVVTPHNPASRLAFLEPDGRTHSLVLPSEASTKSLLRDGVLYTGAKGRLTAIDVRTREMRDGPRLAEDTLGYLHWHEPSGLLAMVEDKGAFCHLGRLDSLSAVGNVPLRLPGDCQLLDADTLLVSELAWPGRRLKWVRLADKSTMRETRLVDLGFNEIAVDAERRRVYAPSTLRGSIAVLDLDTLALRERFRTPVGVRGVRPSADATRLYAWNYFDGALIEHELPGGRILHTWRLGLPLRHVTFDCDNRALLVTTCLGGFRIDPTALPKKN
jgi:hypothetical protein